MTDKLRCWNCGATLDQVLLPVSRHEYCPDCAEAVHCCRMCRHFDPALAEQCREDRAEPPTNRESANFCDFFQPLPGGQPATSDSTTPGARARLEALFGNSDSAGAADAAGSKPPDNDARRRLDALFDDDDEA